MKFFFSLFSDFFRLLLTFKPLCTNVCLVTKKLRNFFKKLDLSQIFFIFLANCCLLMANLTFSALGDSSAIFADFGDDFDTLGKLLCG